METQVVLPDSEPPNTISEVVAALRKAKLGNNQVHTVPNVYVTDGAFMTSASCVNPSLTYMAFSARAANHAAQQLKNEA